MPKYRVLMRGENFHTNRDGVSERIGFYITRYVEADGEQKAENLVLRMLRSDPEIISIAVNDTKFPPKLFLDEIEEVIDFTQSANDVGKTIFLMDCDQGE